MHTYIRVLHVFHPPLQRVQLKNKNAVHHFTSHKIACRHMKSILAAGSRSLMAKKNSIASSITGPYFLIKCVRRRENEISFEKSGTRHSPG